MELRKYEDKVVVIQTTDNTALRGKVEYYFYPEDNENGEESIGVRDFSSGLLIDINKVEIKSIEIVE